MSKNAIDRKIRGYSAKQTESRRDPDSGKFVTAEAAFDDMEQLFAALERDVLGDFT